MTEPVRWGVIGAADFARREMAPAIHMAENAVLAGLATSSPQKAAGFQAFNPDLKLYSDYDSLLASPDIDAVYIPLPNHLHVEWTLKALNAGKHVLTEKPIAMKADEIDSLIDARNRTGLVAAEAYMIVHHSQWKRAKSLYEQGAIGRLIHVNGHFSYDNAADVDNVRNRPETGGGGIPDIGVYTYGCTRWLTGQEPVQITHADIDFENGVDVLARVSARFDGFTASWVNSMRMHAYQEMTFVGDKGVLRLSTPFNAGSYGPALLEIHNSAKGGNGGEVVTERFSAENQYANQVEAFGRSVRFKDAYPWSLEDAKGTQAMIDGVFERARQ